jgi:hypothetical protein
MTQLSEEHFELHDANKAKRYPEQKIKKARDTLREILKTHYYDIKGRPQLHKIIPDIIGSRVAKKLEDLVGYLK